MRGASMGGWLLSRSDRLIVARHEVSGCEGKDSRPGGTVEVIVSPRTAAAWSRSLCRLRARAANRRYRPKNCAARYQSRTWDLAPPCAAPLHPNMPRRIRRNPRRCSRGNTFQRLSLRYGERFFENRLVYFNALSREIRSALVVKPTT